MHAPPSVSDGDGRAMRISLGRRSGPPAGPSGRSVGSRTPSGSARMTLGSQHIAVVGARPCRSARDRHVQAGDTWPDRARTPCTVAGKPLLWDDWRPAASNAIWLCDRDGEALGKVDLQWLEPDGEILEAGTVWDDSGRRLAAWVSTESRTHLGLIDTSLYAFDSLVCVDDVHQWGVGPPILLWRNDELIFCYEAEAGASRLENVVLRVATLSGKAERVLREERWDPSRRPMHIAVLSPDRRYLLFDRVFSPKLIAAGGTCAGIWLLDLESGECTELTYENAGRYEHHVPRWEGPNTFLFVRHDQGPTQRPSEDQPGHDVWRARLESLSELDSPEQRLAEKAE